MSVSKRLTAARGAVEEFTQLAEGDSDLVDELLAAYAHELANMIRESSRSFADSAAWAANLIDPEVRA